MTLLLGTDDASSALDEMASAIVARGRPAPLIVGVRRGGVPVAEELRQRLERRLGGALEIGTLDITLYRDDASTALPSLRIGPSQIPGSLDGRRVIVVDDVLFTGRTVRAALDELHDHGRPSSVELAVLIDRGGRELPIQADYVGRRVELAPEFRVDVLQGKNGLSAIAQPGTTPTSPPPAMNPS
jgi:pyrimidine operon attenuation protein/uracil phosphoribosyltransferase